MLQARASNARHNACVLGDSLTVELSALTRAVLVRIQVPQPATPDTCLRTGHRALTARNLGRIPTQSHSVGVLDSHNTVRTGEDQGRVSGGLPRG